MEKWFTMKKVVVRWALIAVLAILIPSPVVRSQYDGESRSERDARMKWWREARFGMFIHWGVYSVPAGVYHGKQNHFVGEWLMHDEKIPVAEYKKFAKDFNPVKYNADEWVSLAKEAGMKYMVITARHHDGFAMFHSKVSDWNIYDATPFKRDPLKELAAACQKHDMKLGFYFSQSHDWVHPGGAIPDHRSWDPAQKGDIDEFLKKISEPQLRELMTNYGPISILWWDASWDMNKERADLLLPLLKLQPGIITSDRLGGDYPGDFASPEQSIPGETKAGRDWETCMTMNETWGYKLHDNKWKSTETLLRMLISSSSKGGNFLLNVGPTSEGLIPEPSVERLKEMGEWMKVNGEAIYATSAGPFKSLPWGYCTQKPGKLYLHVFDWPKDGQLVVPISNAVIKAYLLADRLKLLRVRTAKEDKIITLPAIAPDLLASVVVVEIAGLPNVTARYPAPKPKVDEGATSQ